jgi:hypothetical protein
MVWREASATDQREECARLALAPGASRQELCRRLHGLADGAGLAMNLQAIAVVFDLVDPVGSRRHAICKHGYAGGLFRWNKAALV